MDTPRPIEGRSLQRDIETDEGAYPGEEPPTAHYPNAQPLSTDPSLCAVLVRRAQTKNECLRGTTRSVVNEGAETAG